MVESLESRCLLAGDLVSHWNASDLSGRFAPGERIDAWTDRVAGRDALAIGSPTLINSEFAGQAMIQFEPTNVPDGFRIRNQDNPTANASEYSFSITFATTASQSGGNGPWFQNTALLDASALGLSYDWGLSINAAGQLSTGMGDGFTAAPQTVYSTESGLHDGQLHSAVVVRAGSQLDLYVDGQLSVSSDVMSAAVRDNSSLTIGMSIAESLGFTGAIADIRFYDGALATGEVADLQSELDRVYHNQPPVAHNDQYELEEDTPLFYRDASVGVLANDTDAEIDHLTATLVEPPAHGTLELFPDGSFVYSPSANFHGTDSFTYWAADSQTSNVATVQLTVNNVYDPPSAEDDFYKLRPNGALQIPDFLGVLTNDLNPEQAELSVELVQNITGGSLQLQANGAFTYDPLNFRGTTSFSYRISDGIGFSTPATVQLVVNSVPIANTDTYQVNEDDVLSVTAVNGVLRNDIDPDGDSLTALLVDPPTFGQLALDPTGAFLYSPMTNFFGQDSFTYRNADAHDQSPTTTVTIGVKSINDPPVAVTDTYFTAADQVLTVRAADGVLRNDEDIEQATLVTNIDQLPAHGQLIIQANGAFEYTPNAGFQGVDGFAYFVSDSEITSEPTTVRLYVGTSPVVISEFMAANVDTLETRLRAEPDDRFRGDASSPDWIELHNRTDADFDIGGFHLTDNRNNHIRWTFPASTFVPANGYLVVFASGSDVTDPNLDELGLLHTNFAIGLEPGYLALTFPNGLVAHEWEYPSQYPRISFGSTSAADSPQFLQTASPAEPNAASLDGAVANVEFSQQRGFYDSPFTVSLSSPTSDAVIRYTTDGSEPTAESGLLYTNPIPVDSTTTLRAAAFKTNHVASAVVTQTYLFLEDVIQQPFLPAGYPSEWANMPADYGMDPEVIGPDNLFDDVYRNSVMDDLKTLPSLSLSFDVEDMFGDDGIYQNPTRTGDSWERAMSVEYFSADGSEPGFQINSGVRVVGGSSREPDIPKHSFRLEFREAYGAAKLQYSLFDQTPFADGVTDTFDELIVRVGFNNSWMHRHYYQGFRGEQPRDQWVRDMHASMGHPTAKGKYVHVYLNGMYWGIYNLHERPAAPYMEEYFGGDKDTEWNVINSGQAIDGDVRTWTSILSTASRGLSSDEAYQAFTQEVDVVSLADYMLLNFYIGNTDWDGHNWIAARRNNNDKWRFYAWDSEFAISLPPPNTAVGESAERQIINVDRTSLDSANGPTRLHARASANEEYRLLFADRVHQHMFHGGTLTPEVATDLFLARSGEIDRAVVAESARWGDFRRDVNPGQWRSDQFDLFHRNEHYLNQREFITDRYLPVRTDIVLGQLRRRRLYPDIGAPEFNQHGGSVAAGFAVSMTAPSGTIYYTTDGSDPRLPGGAIAETALVYSDALVLDQSVTLQARVWQDGEWSALNAADFSTAVEPTSNSLRISEIHYHPADPTTDEFAAGFDNADDFEFIELANIGDRPVSLTNVRLLRTDVNGDAEGVDFVFATGAIQELQPGARMIVVEDEAAFTFRYGQDFPVAGQWSGQLNNGGEQITLTWHDQVLQQFTYDDQWHSATDGDGSSLEIVNVAASLDAWNTADGWRPSRVVGGSPGTSNLVPGDSNRDGIFNSADLVLVFQAGEYEDAIVGNSTWEDGDWNGDGEFNSNDFVFAFEAGTFIAASRRW
ncbi:MAG: tandem-95 repeat protein [Planctomycetales bacterium]|nr:tandem-95 repeat protein [Planctomycetales bacterium]